MKLKGTLSSVMRRMTRTSSEENRFPIGRSTKSQTAVEKHERFKQKRGKTVGIVWRIDLIEFGVLIVREKN